MKTITYEGVQHGDWVRCVLCGADKCFFHVGQINARNVEKMAL